MLQRTIDKIFEGIMSLQVSYMGTKKQLAPVVAQLVAQCPNGPLLDLFSGVCAVGEAVSPTRQVWNNDAQIFASTVAKAFFKSKDAPLASDALRELATPLIDKNYDALQK